MATLREARSQWRFTVWDMMVCIAALAVITASFVSEESVLMPTLAFFLLTHLFLRLWIALLPTLGAVFLGMRKPACAELSAGSNAHAELSEIGRLILEKHDRKALERLDAAVDRWGNNASFAMLQAGCHRRLGEIPEAVEVLERSVEENPSDPVLYYALACYLSRAGRAPAALDALSIALELDQELRELLEDEPDFEAIRGEEDFARLRADPLPQF